jgi:hypothetical protein
MADSPDNVNSWPGFLNQLNKTFLLIRDLFGYALPGGVFLATGIIFKRFSVIDVKNLFLPYQAPAWAIFILVVAACYVVGDIMAAIAYFPIAFRKWIQWRRYLKNYLYPLKDRPPEYDNFLKEIAERLDWLMDNPTEVTGDLLAIRKRYPEFLDSLDRRETMLLMSLSNAAALLTGTVVFYWHPSAAVVLIIAGILLASHYLTGFSHLRRVRHAIREADKIAEAGRKSGSQKITVASGSKGTVYEERSRIFFWE